jgi:hypothetical protein
VDECYLLRDVDDVCLAKMASLVDISLGFNTERDVLDRYGARVIVA